VFERGVNRIEHLLAEGRITEWRAAFLAQQRAQIMAEIAKMNRAATEWADVYIRALYQRGLDNVDGWLMQHVYREQYSRLIAAGKSHDEAVLVINELSGGVGPGGLSRPWGAHPWRVTPMDLTFTKLHHEAVEHAVRSFLMRVHYQTGGIARNVEDIFRKAQLLEVQRAFLLGDTVEKFSARVAHDLNTVYGAKIKRRILELEPRGLSPSAILSKLRDEELISQRMIDGLEKHLARRGMSNDPASLVDYYRSNAGTEFIDSLGRRWDMGRYTEMLARTTAREADDLARWTRYAEVGVNLVRVVGTSMYPRSPCIPYEDQVLLLYGEADDEEYYDTMENAMAAGYKHPNCIHTEVPVIRDVGRYRRDPEALVATITPDDVRRMRERRLGTTMREALQL